MAHSGENGGVLRALIYVCMGLTAVGGAMLAAQDAPDAAGALVARAIATQHRNDDALMLYERRERRMSFRSLADATAPATAAEDKKFRVVPTGTGTLRLLLEENGRGVSQALYAKQLRDLESALAAALIPAESRQRQRVDKYERRSRERASLVDAMGRAFRFTLGAEEERGGRRLRRVEFAPAPEFKPNGRSEEMLRHVRGVLWLEEASGQMARLEAEVSSDISVGGGVLGKIYRGSRVLIEQEPVGSPVNGSVWLPVRYEYHLTGRKFVFGFEQHEVTIATGYRRIGPPSEALASVRHELNNGAVPPAAQE